MRRGSGLLILIAAIAAGWSSLDNSAPWDGPIRASGASGNCASTVIVRFSRGRYPNIVDHIEDSWRMGYPRVLRIYRPGKDERREKLLDRYQARHPQPKGDGLDLDEAPAAVLRRHAYRADVRPVPQGENRSAGGSLGAQLRGYGNGTCVRYRFTR